MVNEINLGENVRKYNNVTIRQTSVGDNSILADDSFITNCCIGKNVIVERRCMLFNTTIGDYTVMGFNDVIRNAKVGKYCSLAWNISLGGAEHPYKNISTHFFPYDKYDGFVDAELNYPDFNPYVDHLCVGNDVWIAAGAQVLRGCKVSDGAIIAAGAVVTHDVGPYEIWAGVPAKKIGQRFSDEIIADLIEISWWNLPEEIIRTNICLFQQELNIDILAQLKELANINRKSNQCLENL